MFKKNFLNLISEYKLLKLYLCTLIYICIFVSLFFNLNSSEIFGSIFFEDIVYFILFDTTLLLLALTNLENYKLKFILKNKIWLFITFILLIFYLNKFDFNYLKLILYIFPLILITEVRKIFSLVNFNKILKLLKLSLFFILIL